MDNQKPAFPIPDFDEQGMTLRDYFAAKAMQSLIIVYHKNIVDEYAQRAYEIADAMLKARGE